MARPVRKRIIAQYPDNWTLTPEEVSGKDVVLSLEEYETVRLIDYLSLTQAECAEKMGISRTTVTAIYESARKKISLALIEGRRLLISGGSYALGALRGGTALISHEAARSDELQGLVDLALNSGFAVGLRSTGTVVSPGFDLDWKQIVSISASGTGILGLTADGNVCSHFFRESNRLDFSGVTDAVAIAAGGTHSAVVHADGSVSVFGRCDEGQGSTADWQLYG